MTNEEQILAMLSQNQEIMQKTYESAEKTRKYFLYSVILTILMFLLPIVGLMLIIPQFLESYSNISEGML